MPSRSFTGGIVGLGLLLAPWTAAARDAPAARGEPAVRAWLTDLVTRIDDADRARPRTGPDRSSGTVVVRVVVAADGSIRGALVERASGSPRLDRRALRAVQGAGPLAAPPAALLTGTGLVDLSVPVRLGR
jgi:TonB family protein